MSDQAWPFNFLLAKERAVKEKKEEKRRRKEEALQAGENERKARIE